jgi:hypothetical protein
MKHGRERGCPQCQRVMSGASYVFPFRDYGLTKRELFAAMFTAAAIANPDITAPVGTIVSDSIAVADRLITALNEPDEDEEDAS